MQSAKDTTYQVYVVKNFKDTSSFEKKGKGSTGKIRQCRATIRYGLINKLEPGEKFAIVIFYKYTGCRTSACH